jgi:23S rRNA (uracil1939-C5)-methyltransferase
MGKRRAFPLLEKMEIIDAGSEGKAVARKDNMVVFVPFLVPGDIADIQVVRKKKKFYEGRAVKIYEYSKRRTDPLCSHFGLCGGCKWQNMKYEEQLLFKQKQVRDNFDRLGTFQYPDILPIKGSPNSFSYRNKLEYTFSNRKWLLEKPDRTLPEPNLNGLGFHMPGMFDRIVDIDKCYLQDDLTNKIRNSVREYALKKKLSFYDVKKWEGLLRNLIVRNTTTGEWMVIVVFRNEDDALADLMEHIRTGFPELTSLMYCINPKKNDDISDREIKLFHGRDHIIEEMVSFEQGKPPLHFKIGPKSFFQTNSLQAAELYRTALQFADPGRDEIIYDLYCGTGTISCYAAERAGKVIGIEYIDMAVRDAGENAALNRLDNITFVAGDLAATLNEEFVEQYGKPNTIITDPPRSGMHPKVVEQILKINSDKIVYVSCNPATQARDISLLDSGYKVDRVQPIDMFPHTQHVENVVLLTRRF